MNDETFDIIIKVHVRAPFRLIRAAAPYLRIKGNKENRSIVNVSSTSGLHGNIGKFHPLLLKAENKLSTPFSLGQINYAAVSV